MVEQLVLEITNRCPLNCKYCYIKKGKDFLEKEKIFEIVDKFEPKRINISGGDPLLHRDFREIIKGLEKRGQNFNVLTSGVLITGANVEAFRGVEVQLTLDGPKEYHNKMRGKYTRVIEAIKLLKAAGAEIEVATVLTRENIKHLDDTARILSELGVENWRVIRMIPVRKNLLPLALRPEDVEKVVPKLVELEDLYGINISSFWLYSAYLWKVKRKYMGECPAGREKLVITPKGKILPCEFLRNLRISWEKLRNFKGCPAMALRTGKGRIDPMFL